LWQDSAYASRFKQSIIDKIYAAGLRPIFRILKSELTIEEANALEMKMIAKIGRRDQGLGPLVNLTDGGDGGTGREMSEETKRHLSKLNRSRSRKAHLSELLVWAGVFDYVSGYTTISKPAKYKCVIHGPQWIVPHELVKKMRSAESSGYYGRPLCPVCSELLRGINISRSKRGKSVLCSTPEGHVKLMKKVIAHYESK
jgi:hypothetical protein